jgi:thiosulfate reductase cytochrome b subunit
MNVPQPVKPPALPDLGMRVIYMLLFGVVFWVLCWILAATTLVQLIMRLLNGRANPDLIGFGAALARYARQVIEFLTFVTERTPYPFAAWPAEG